MEPKQVADVKRFVPFLGIVIVAGLTLLSGAVHGWMSNRWGPPQSLVAAAEQLEDVPRQFGSWQLESSEEMSEHVVTMLECAGYILRTYVNQETGETVRVVVLLGPSGPMSTHTPEICYSSRDYAVYEETQQVTIRTAEGSEEQFWALTFRANNLDADLLRVYYAWNAGDRWWTPQEPRFTFADKPFLYKIQLAGYLPPLADTETSDPCRRFLEDFMPVIKPYLVDAI